MAAPAPWFLEQEARALLMRLRRVRPLAVQETMLPAAAIAPGAYVEIERLLVRARMELQRQVRRYIRWLRANGRQASPAEMQRRYVLLRLRFTEVITQADYFSDLLTQRSEAETGVFLSGLDTLATDGMAIPAPSFEQPHAVCYLERGPGAAIRRARTRLPGGGNVEVAIVRVPRERMVGALGVGASVLHEVGHQASACLDLGRSFQGPLRERAGAGTSAEQRAWAVWRRSMGEVLGDFWGVGKLGISASLGLMAVISLPRFFVFRAPDLGDDPHPSPWIRLKASVALGQALYPDPQWGQLLRLWDELYPPAGLAPRQRESFAALEETLPALAALIVDHRPRSLGGRALRDVMPTAERTPARLMNLFHSWRDRPEAMRAAAPSLAVAVVGQARAAGALSPETESLLLRNLLAHWAIRSTAEAAETAVRRRAPTNGRSPAAPPSSLVGTR